MSETGRSDPPRGLRPGDAIPQNARQAQALKIESIQGELSNLKRAVQIQGVVTRITRDGTATIQTDQGDIEVKLRGNVTLEPGQVVDVELPPGNPPRQAIVKPAAVEPPVAQPQQPQPPVTTTPSPSTPAEESAPAPRPLPPAIPAETRILLEELSNAIRSGAIAEKTPVPLPLDAIIRLVPLTALPPVNELLPTTLPTKTEVVLPLQTPQTLPNSAAIPTPITTTPPAYTAPQPLQILDDQPANPVLPQGAPVTAAPQTIDTILQTAIPNTALTPALTLQPTAGIQSALTTSLLGDIKTPPPAGFIDARVISILPPDDVTLIAPGIATKPSLIDDPNIRPSLFHADVVAKTTQNIPILSVGIQNTGEPELFMMQFPVTNLPIGTQLSLVPQPSLTQGVAPLPSDMLKPTPAFTILSGWTWPVFDDALDQLGINPAMPVMAQSMANMIPNPANPQQMPSAILFLMAAARSGDVSGWMGEKALNILRRDNAGKGMDILAKLGRDFAGLSEMMDQPVSQDWKAMALPMLWQGEIHKIHLYYRHQDTPDDKESPDESGDGRSTRFIFDLNLSRIGDVQIDGLMKGKRLDLILRTPTPFAHSMQSVMRQKYLDVLESGNLTGDLAFQGRGDQMVKIDVRPHEFGISA